MMDKSNGSGQDSMTRLIQTLYLPGMAVTRCPELGSVPPTGTGATPPEFPPLGRLPAKKRVFLPTGISTEAEVSWNVTGEARSRRSTVGKNLKPSP